VDWRKRPETTYLQTWHGTPLKRVHHDVFWAPPGRLARLDADVERWDYLLSPNAASTPRLRDAFRFSGQMLETGYPRNDVLTSAGADRVRARIRKSLGIDEGTVAVLYAPTWRDDEYFGLDGAQPGRALDFEAFEEQLGRGHRLLVRLHPMMTDRMARVQHSGVLDVSYHPDVQELYLAADVLITDYSSTMFDFAVTAKPILFYAYDLERYRDSLRGFYFDFTPVAPGPILRTSAEVIDQLHDLPAMNAAYADRYAEFRRTFCHYDDGHAADRLDWLTHSGDRRPQVHAALDAAPVS
jgi:CDP-glycerol glycerophosphotransferase